MLSVRSLRCPDELAPFVALRNRALPESPRTEYDLWAVLEHRPHRELFLAEDGGTAVGGASIVDLGYDVPDALVLVPPEHRRRGIGTDLLRCVSKWAAAHRHSQLLAFVVDGSDGGPAFARRHGFVEQRRAEWLELDLTAVTPPAVVAPEGVEIVCWADRPELARAMYALDLVVIGSTPGEEDWIAPPFEQWLAADLGGPIDRRPATFVALSGDEVIGYTTLVRREATPRFADNAGTGVAPEWRGRGVARALKATQIRWARAAGYERLRTENEERNLPIKRLNESLGYRPSGRVDVALRGPVAC